MNQIYVFIALCTHNTVMLAIFTSTNHPKCEFTHTRVIKTCKNCPHNFELSWLDCINIAKTITNFAK